MKNASTSLRVLALLLACIAPVALVAADDGTTNAQRPARGGRGGPPAAHRLAAANLTDEQKAAIAAIQENARAARQEGAEETRAAMRAVLTPEQLAALDAKPAPRLAGRGEGRPDGRGGPPGRGGGRGGPGPGRGRGGPPPA